MVLEEWPSRHWFPCCPIKMRKETHAGSPLGCCIPWSSEKTLTTMNAKDGQRKLFILTAKKNYKHWLNSNHGSRIEASLIHPTISTFCTHHALFSDAHVLHPRLTAKMVTWYRAKPCQTMFIYLQASVLLLKFEIFQFEHCRKTNHCILSNRPPILRLSICSCEHHQIEGTKVMRPEMPWEVSRTLGTHGAMSWQA